MNKRTTDIVAYLTWIGLIVAFVAGDRQRSKFHLNQALVLAIVSVAWAVIYRVAYVVLGVATFGLANGLLGADVYKRQTQGWWLAARRESGPITGSVNRAGTGPWNCCGR